jgi:hypothetical protein
MTPSISSGAAALTSRRAALGLGLGAVAGAALGGCALNNPLSEEKTPAARAVRDLAPDVAVAVEAVTLLRGAETAVTSTSQQHPDLAPRLADLLALHRAHLDAVVRAVPKRVDTTGTGPAYAVPPGPARALAQLHGSEQSLHDGLIGLAVRAQSGPFARLLGSMAAAVSQRLTGLAA